MPCPPAPHRVPLPSTVSPCFPNAWVFPVLGSLCWGLQGRARDVEVGPFRRDLLALGTRGSSVGGGRQQAPRSQEQGHGVPVTISQCVRGRVSWNSPDQGLGHTSHVATQPTREPGSSEGRWATARGRSGWGPGQELLEGAFKGPLSLGMGDGGHWAQCRAGLQMGLGSQECGLDVIWASGFMGTYFLSMPCVLGLGPGYEAGRRELPAGASP